jgi:MSHA biogenesis protein MshP
MVTPIISPKTTFCFEKEKGSALLLTLFIIIVLILLGGALMRVLSTSSESIAQEVIGTRAYMAANSAMQAELQKLFPLNSTSTCPLAPLAPLTSYYDFSTAGVNVDGLYHCKAETSCSWYATHPETNEQFYRLTSTGKCASSVLESTSKDIVVSSRTIQVEARTL